MPSSTSKQISYPCPLIGNAGDYDPSAEMIFKYTIDPFPKKLIFYFEKPKISDLKIQTLLDQGVVDAYAEFNSPATFNIFCKRLNFSKDDIFPVEINFGELNRKVRIRFFLAASKESEINPMLLAKDFPSESFLAKKLDMLGKSKSIIEDIDHQFDPFLSNASSIFMITPNTDNEVKSQVVDFERDKINIKLPKESFKEYQYIKKDSNIPMFHCAIIFPVLTDAFNILNKLENKESNENENDDEIEDDKQKYGKLRWYTRLKDIKEARNLSGTPYEMADKLLNNPVIKLIKSNYLQDKTASDGDDDE